MPRKIRELKADLKRSGFIRLKGRGKGSHEVWKHPLLTLRVVIAGKDGDDADPYKEKDVRDALKALESLKKSEDEE
jgi:predicted RNA binding protein YcfA (HicA-like mRNA interferase family)